MKNIDKELLNRAINELGFSHQILKTIEELSELSRALSRELQTEDNQENVDEEIADVLIMVNQLFYIFKNKKNVKRYLREKQDKLKYYLENKK